MTTRELAVNMEMPHSKPNPGDIEIPNRVFVKGFARETNEDELKEFFEEYGIVRESKIVRDKLGVSKGYGFITFDSQDIAEKVRDLQILEYCSKELILGPARIRKKRPTFRPRLDQVVNAGYPVYNMGTMQQPMYVQPAGEGLWYFQGGSHQVVPVVPNQIQVTSQNYWQQPYSTTMQLQSSAQVYPISPAPSISATAPTTYSVNNWNEVVRYARKAGTSLVPVTPPESPEYANGNSPVQCVPIYDGNFVSEEVGTALATPPEGQGVVLIDTGERKLKKVIMRRDNSKHTVVQGQHYANAGSMQSVVHATVAPE